MLGERVAELRVDQLGQRRAVGFGAGVPGFEPVSFWVRVTPDLAGKTCRCLKGSEVVQGASPVGLVSYGLFGQGNGTWQWMHEAALSSSRPVQRACSCALLTVHRVHGCPALVHGCGLQYACRPLGAAQVWQDPNTAQSTAMHVQP